MKTRQHNDVDDYIGVIYDENETELSNQSNRLWYVTKTKKDNDMTDYTSAVNIENESKLSWSIGLGAVCNENQIGQQHDRSYECFLRWKWN